MRETIRHHIDLGVDNIKLSMSGEQITETRDAQDCYYTDAETAACVDEAHRNGVRLCAHARARDSVKMCIRHGVDIIYHASWIDEEGMEMLDKNKHKHMVAPGLNWLIGTLYEAGAFGYSFEKAEKVGYKKELDVAIPGLKEMHKRGITVLPGGDYGFAWTPHGTYVLPQLLRASIVMLTRCTGTQETSNTLSNCWTLRQWSRLLRQLRVLLGFSCVMTSSGS